MAEIITPATLAQWLSGWVAGPATLLEWLSGWVARMDNKLPSLVADYCSCMEKFFRYIRTLSPVKNISAHIASEFIFFAGSVSR